MAGSIQFHQKCICGAEISLVEQFEFIGTSRAPEKFNQWQQQHNRCLPLFLQIQEKRLRRLEDGRSRG